MRVFQELWVKPLTVLDSVLTQERMLMFYGGNGEVVIITGCEKVDVFVNTASHTMLKAILLDSNEINPMQCVAA